MIELRIDMANFIDQSRLLSDQVVEFRSVLLDKLAEGFENQWMDEIKGSLHSTRAEYMRGMFVDRPDENTVVMGVTSRRSKLAVDLELGKDAFDEKTGFAASPKRIIKKNGKGWYLTIPFRHAVPGAVGESEAFTSVMPMSVYRLAKNNVKPLKLSDLPIEHQRKTTRPEMRTSTGQVFKAYQHKTARYQGLFRLPDSAENRGQYMTFRRVSDLSDANSWIHPGFIPRALLQKALNNTNIPALVQLAKLEYFGTK